MKSILSPILKRVFSYVGVFFILYSFSIFSLRAQQSSDFELTTTTTTATCENDGAIEAKVKSKNPIYTIKSVTYTYYNQATGSLIATQNTLTSKVTGLGKGIFSVEASVLINENGTITSLKKENIQVNTTYKTPTISIGVYRPSFKKKPTGMISVRVTNGSASKYTVKLLSVPSGYTAYKEFEFSATENNKYFYNLPAGEYMVQVSDRCNNYPAQKLSISDKGLPEKIDRNVPEPHRANCGWYDFNTPFRKSNLYFANVDTLKKYIDVAFDRPAQLTSSSSVWKSFVGLPTTIDDSHDIVFDPAKFPDKKPLSVKLKHGDTWYKMTRATSETDKNVLAYRVKGTDEIQQYQLDYRDKYPWVASYLAFNGFPCGTETHGRKTWLTEKDVAYCPPVTVTVAEKNKPNVEVTEPLTLTIDNVGWAKGVDYKDKKDPTKTYQFESQKEYIITAKDSNGNVQKMEIGKMNPTFDPLVNNKVEDYCVGEKKSNLSLAYTIPVSKVISEDGRKYEEYRDIISFKDYTVTLVDAPAGFTPPSGAVCKKNIPYKIPHEYHKKRFYPFGTTGDPDKDAKEYIDLPTGTYKFEIEDRCHKKMLDTLWVNSSPEKYALGTNKIAPKIEVKDCGRVRIYPFGSGIDNIILKNNVSYADEELYAHITELPTGVKDADIQVGSGGSSRWLRAKVDESKRYFDLPATKGMLKISVKIRTKNGVEIYPSCIHNTTEVDLSNANLGYDRDSYVGYKCPSGKTGYVYFIPINCVGNLDIALRSADGNATTVMEQKDVTVDPSKGIEFNLSSTTALADDYLLYLKDLTCQNDNGKGTPITLYDLGSTSIVRTTRIKSKYCEGDSIRLEAVSLGGKVEYQWTLPDGSKYPTTGPSKDARVYKITSATNAQHSGEYTLEAKNVICEGAPTSIHVKFKLSVAPTVLWWASNAQNANWYDVENWRNTQGEKAKAIPAPCTTVHIPSEVDNFYPDLDPSISKYDEKQGTYGAAECNDVYFHYGAQLGHPQMLRYSRAFVDYNFGKMQASGTVEAHAEAKFPQSDKRLMERDHWYMLATPLKNILSGDFGLAGYPMTYQRHFKLGLTNPSGLSEASFEKPVNSLAENMSSFNHAIALKVAGYNAGKEGYSDHKNLNGLNGIIRLPYYLNRTVDTYYPLHKYIETSKTSAFRYYNMETLTPMNKVDRYVRKPEEDFRFVFETEANKAIGAITVSGTLVEGYAFQLTGDTNSELRMVGNPFMSAIDFDRLKEVNSTLIEPYYYVFTDNTWKVYYSGVTSSTSTLQKEIAPLQAIVIKKRATGSLLFPTAGDKNVLLAPNKQWNVKSYTTTESSDLVRRVTVVASNSAGCGAEAILLPDTELSPAPALFYPAVDEVPTVYFVDTAHGTPNIIQSGDYRSIVPMGVHSSVVGMVDLDFSSLSRNLFTRVALYDRQTNQEQDLLANPHYSYLNGGNEGTRFELRLDYPGVKHMETPLADGELLRVIRTEAGYRVESEVALQSVSLWAVDGKLLAKSFESGALDFFVDRAYCQSVVILKVHLADGSTLTRKLPQL